MLSAYAWVRRRVLTMLMLYSEGRPGVFAGTVYILPGTHHVRFLVDGIMQTSPDLPTTVDFGNNLVNYIEVSADDLPSAQRSATTAAGITPEQAATKAATQADEASNKLPRGKAVPSTSQYFHAVPQYLIDFDQPEESTVYQYAIQAIDKLPQPPSLPGFLAKPILNAGVLMKDDNSVLNMPNHTVLNHLATSSIKNNILAVSATTRYKSKVSVASFDTHTNCVRPPR
jgi:5'-AMP-activated protein kinase beta subunit-like protein/AMP-activated protein kinase-like protein